MTTGSLIGEFGGQEYSVEVSIAILGVWYQWQQYKLQKK